MRLMIVRIIVMMVLVMIIMIIIISKKNYWFLYKLQPDVVTACQDRVWIGQHWLSPGNLGPDEAPRHRVPSKRKNNGGFLGSYNDNVHLIMLI